MPKEYLDEPIELLNRSRESYKTNHKTTFDAGKLVPFLVQPVIAGETWQLRPSALVRTLSLITCPLDDAYFSIWAFWVPSRILWKKYKNFRGELEDYWTGTETSYTIPQILFPSGGFDEDSVADHLGIPTKVAPSSTGDQAVTINSLPLRAIAHIWNEWFRDQNLMPKILVSDGDQDQTGAHTGGDFINTAALGGDLPPLARPHDLFGSALPFAQRGTPEPLPITGSVPVWSVPSSIFPESYGSEGLKFKDLQYPATWSQGPISLKGLDLPQNTFMLYGEEMADSTSNTGKLSPMNLRALFNVSGAALSTTIEDLRVSIAIQHLKERMAISGSRYREILRSMYGVEYPDPLMDIPTYLGGFSQPIDFQPVVQTSATDSVSPQGNVAGYSSTGFLDDGFQHSALEDGWIVFLGGVRNSKTYQQGLDRMFQMKDELDIWNPMFNGLGQMGIKYSEIYLANAGSGTPNYIFGYQDAWYWYHNRPNVVTGQLRSNATNSLDVWHFADKYQSQPVLGRTWMSDNSATNINRVLAAQAPTYPQFLADITIEGTVISAMPVHATPGLDRV